MPFYNAQEATNAVKGLLGEFYVEDHSPIPTALWHAATKCRFVEDEGDVLFYKY
jgi:omega-6 fatty acid desaturase (delta-12 desaturase)